MKKEYCPCCNQPIMKHKQNLCKAYCDILLIAAMRFKKEIPFHLKRDLPLTKSQYNNFQKLRYWGLVEKTMLDGRRVCGFWQLTGLAGAFINGKRLPKYKWTFNNSVVESSIDTIGIEDAVGSFDIPEQWAERAETVKVGELF